jgi:hypothetical protein
MAPGYWRRSLRGMVKASPEQHPTSTVKMGLFHGPLEGASGGKNRGGKELRTERVFPGSALEPWRTFLEIPSIAEVGVGAFR